MLVVTAATAAARAAAAAAARAAALDEITAAAARGRAVVTTAVPCGADGSGPNVRSTRTMFSEGDTNHVCVSPVTRNSSCK
jgi:hypothetical protein